MHSISKYKKTEYGAQASGALHTAEKGFARKKAVAFFVALLMLVLSSFIVSDFTLAYADDKTFENPVKAGVFNFEG